ncbi:serine hydrolase domain-containing protein [Anaeromicropila herbilytica]|uniref:Beta-lactamase-related domain-containing protein n=1 Tax=Anaeromicropila herbilytica TaxID=2785025 RepID=A0A7R7EIC4_9FIRM|nr:serine hydrolase domain-containing protein [Anaeromicropila herbilytica]BCN29255.1 hypothetical protein bsdtb5_05500 [Anaeromicropila herbilytica]
MISRKKKITMGIVLIATVLCACLSLVKVHNTYHGDTVEEKLNSVIQKYHVQGASYTIIKDGKVTSSHNIGYANVKQKKVVDDNTAFKIASISKTMTAYAIMQLVDQKKLDLDTPVEQYIKNWSLPKTKFDNSKVTLRTLMSHTSGITDSSEFGYTEPLPTVVEALTQRDIRLKREPGTEFEYSSFSGFAICQLIIENVTGEKFEDYMKGHVFAKLDMKRAGYYNKSEENITLATPYAGLNKPVGVTPIVMTGAGGVSATSSDMANFVIGMIDYYQSSNRQMFQTQKNTKSVFGTYGLGIIPHKLDNGTIVYEHNGTLTGWNAQIAFEPKSKNGMVFLCNSDKGYYLTNEVMRIWSKEVNGYGVEDKAFENSMANIINAIWITVTVVGSLLIFTLIQGLYNKKRERVKGRKNIIKLIVSILVSCILLAGWYMVMYSDYIFSTRFQTPNYYPFTFFTRNIDWIGYSLIFIIIVIVVRRLYPKKLKNTGDEINKKNRV